MGGSQHCLTYGDGQRSERRSARHLTRRGFLRGSAVAGLSMAALSSCGKDGVIEGGDPVENPTIRYGVGAPDFPIDPQVNSNTAGIPENVLETLLTIDSGTGHLQPLLCTALPEVSEDGLTYMLELRDDVIFHDGTPLTSEDVVFTFTRMMLPATQATCADAFSLLAGSDEVRTGATEELEGVRAIDDTHVSMTLKEPCSYWPWRLAQPTASIYPHEACANLSDSWGWDNNLIGTGPYKMRAYQYPNDDLGVSGYATIEANDEYHGGRPAIHTVTFAFTPSASDRVESYRSGLVDCCLLDESALQSLRYDDQLLDRVSCAPQSKARYLRFNLKNGQPEEYLQEPSFRQALSLAIDRPSLCTYIHFGSTVPAAGLIPRGVFGNNPSLDALPYDVEGATELLESIGLDEASRGALTLTIQSMKGFENEANAIATCWGKLGFPVTVETLSGGTWNDYRGRGILCNSIDDAASDLYNGLRLLQDSFTSEAAKTNSTFYASENFDNLLAEALSATDLDTAESLLQEADSLIAREDCAIIPLCWYQTPFLVGTRIGGFSAVQSAPRFADMWEASDEEAD